jgi:2-haloacid dehalogenase
MSRTRPDQPVLLATTRSGVTDIQALVFDTYGTIVDWRAGVLEALGALGRSGGLTVDWEAFLSDWKTRPIMDRVNRGELPGMPMEAIHRQALAEPLVRYGIPAAHRPRDRRSRSGYGGASRPGLTPCPG